MMRWAKPPMDRDQFTLFAPTPDAMIAPEDSVRLVDEILRALDWSAWENQYMGCIGQPPLPPRALAGIILYGLSLGIRSSRQLEQACRVRIDFLWLAEGFQPDHSTLCDFRTKFRAELKDLFGQLGRVAMSLGLVRLNRVGLDGTRIGANSSRHATATAQTLAERVAALEALKAV
jgi:transposase